MTDRELLWVFVIDTEQYAGNFERQLTAWITGCVGDCGVGQREAKQACVELPSKEQAWFENHIVNPPDEHGCRRPTKIWPTPGWYNDGMGRFFKEEGYVEGNKYPAYLSVAIFFNKRPRSKIIDLMKYRASTFKLTLILQPQPTLVLQPQPVTITGFRLLEQILKYKEYRVS